MVKHHKAYEIGIHQMVAARHLNTFRGRILSQHELTSAEWLVLGLASSKSANGGIRVTDLAEVFGVKTTYITALLNTLRAKQFVETKSDPRDARVRLIVATKKGQKTIQAVEKRMNNDLRGLLGDGVGQQDIDAFGDVLQRLSQIDV